MATQTIQSWAVTGETLTMKLYTYNSDTATASASATEATNRKGLYSAAFTDLAAGSYIVQLQTSGGVVRSFFWVKTLAATGTYQAYEVPEDVFAGGGATAAEVADAVWDESANDHKTGNTFGHWVNIIKKSVFNVEGDVNTSVTPTTSTFSSTVSHDDNAFNDQLILFTSGNLEGECRPILSYTQTNGVFVVQEAFTQAPADTDEFVVLPQHIHSVAELTDILKISGSSTAADNLEAILLASGSSTSSIAANVVSSSLTATQIADITTQGKITRRRGDNWSISITGLGSVSGSANIYFGVKRKKNDPDSKSEVLIDTATGLRYIAKEAASTAANGSITIDDAAAGDITIAVEAVETAKTATAGTQYYYDIQWKNASGDIATLEEGDFIIVEDVVRET